MTMSESSSGIKLYKIDLIEGLPVLFESDDGGWELEKLDANEKLVAPGDGSYQLLETYPSIVEVKVLAPTADESDAPNIYYVADKYYAKYVDGVLVRVEGSAYDDDDDDSDEAGDGDDYCEGGDGNDDLKGYGGKDFIRGLGGRDRISGGDDDDRLDGDSGRDQIKGDNGDDEISGGADADKADGGRGDDLFVDGDGSGNDHYIGSSGIDTVSYKGAVAGVTINLQRGKASSASNAAGVGADKLQSIENAIGGDHADTIIGSSVANSLSGEGGDDSLDGLQGVDSYTGGLGADTFIFSKSSDTRLGGAADLITDFSSVEGDVIDLSRIDAKKGFTKNDAFRYVEAPPTEAGDASLGVVWFVMDPGAPSGVLYASTDKDVAAEFAIRVILKDAGATGLDALGLDGQADIIF